MSLTMHESMLETYISSEPVSLSSSNCWKNSNKNHNINGSKKSQGLHSWWSIGVFSLGDNMKCQTYCQIATEFHWGRNILLLLEIQCSMFDIKICIAKIWQLYYYSIKYWIIIKLTISDVSNNKSVLETCISSEPETLSSSKCWKNNNKNENIKSKDQGQ